MQWNYALSKSRRPCDANPATTPTTLNIVTFHQLISQISISIVDGRCFKSPNDHQYSIILIVYRHLLMNLDKNKKKKK